MRISRYDGAMIRELTQVYNLAVREIPHCYRISVRDFGDALAPAVSGERGKCMHSEAVFIASERGSIEGFIHAAIGPVAADGKTDEGQIRFFWYQPGERRAGVALLDAAEEYLRGRKMRTVDAFRTRYLYPFHRMGRGHLSDRQGHVTSLLEFAGYERVHGEIFLTWRNYSFARGTFPEPGLRVRVERPEGKGHAKRQRVIVRLFRADQPIGLCECWPVAENTRSHAAQDWLTTGWLGIDPEENRGRGLGRFLLQRSLWEAHRLGYRHAAINTSWDNHGALMFYSNFGYRVVDCTHCFRRVLS